MMPEKVYVNGVLVTRKQKDRFSGRDLFVINPDHLDQDMNLIEVYM